MNCPKCSAPVAQGAAFCAACGFNLAVASSSPSYPPPPQAHPPAPPQAYPAPPFQAYPVPPFSPPAGFAPQGFVQATPRSSGMAIAGFVLSFFCGLLGLIFSIIGYNECKKSNGMLTGEGLALAGIIISSVSILIGFIMLGAGG